MFRTLARYFRRNVSRFGAARDGATAVEFALIAPAFLAMLFAIIQTTLFLFAQATLQNAAVEAGRLFMTGQAQNTGTSGLTQSQFANRRLSDGPGVVQLQQSANRRGDLFVVQQRGDGRACAVQHQRRASSPSEHTAPARQGDVMVVQLAYPWPIFGMPLGSVLSNTGHGTTEMMGISAFRVEPY